jgi:hypothetical protein
MPDAKSILAIFFGTSPLLITLILNLLDVKQIKTEVSKIKDIISDIKERLAILEERDRAKLLR